MIKIWAIELVGAVPAGDVARGRPASSSTPGADAGQVQGPDQGRANGRSHILPAHRSRRAILCT